MAKKKTDEYLQYAQECARWALEAKDEQDKQVFLDMAKAWTVAALAPQNPKPPTRSGDGSETRPQPHS
jgi:hypothetical protein